MVKQIDVLVKAAQILGADKNGMELSKILKKSMEIDLEHKYNSEDGLAATLNFHTINMRSRFRKPKLKDKNILTSWKQEPHFYRIDTGVYKLLSENEKELFRRALDKEIELVYKDEYTISQLKSALEKI